MHRHWIVVWLFAETIQSALRSGLLMVCPSIPHYPLRCDHVWSGCITPRTSSCLCHHRQRSDESSGCFELEYHQDFGKIWCNISAQCVWKRKSDESALHVFTVGVTAENICGLRRELYFKYVQKGWCDFPSKGCCPRSIIFGGKKWSLMLFEWHYKLSLLVTETNVTLVVWIYD